MSMTSSFISMTSSFIAESAPCNAKQLCQQFLSCAICSGRYADPKLLPCLHTFCQRCLCGYIPAHSLSVTCPVCRQQSILPIDGVMALQDNTFVSSLIETIGNPERCDRCQKPHLPTSSSSATCADCDMQLCLDCAAAHARDFATSSHHVTNTSDPDDGVVRNGELNGTSAPADNELLLVCGQHDGQPLSQYCSNCETAVCDACTEREHREHRTQALAEAVDEHRDSLKLLLHQAREQLKPVHAALASVRSVSTELGRNYNESRAAIDETFDDLIATLERRKEALLVELETVFLDKQKTLESQAQTLESLLSVIGGCCDFTEKSAQNGGDMEVLLVRKEMVDKLTHLCSSSVQILPEDNEHLSFEKSDSSSVTKCLKNFGALRSNSAVAFETVASGEGSETVLDQPADVRHSDDPGSKRGTNQNRTFQLNRSTIGRGGGEQQRQQRRTSGVSPGCDGQW